MIAPAVETPVERVGTLDWPAIESSLDARGFATLPVVLDPAECDALACLYLQDAPFRSRVDMARYRFGSGEYKYFAAPLPPVVQTMRENLYSRLAPIANKWRVRLKPNTAEEFPAALPDFLARCHAAGQERPTPLLLSYIAGDYNCLHQDIYGALAFPLQVVFALSRAGEDYQGGELLLVEQRPRAQSRGHALRIEQGAGVIFATGERPMAGTRGDYRVNMRHGVSTVTDGARMTLGIIFHDAT
jgi:hypothetical protein